MSTALERLDAVEKKVQEADARAAAATQLAERAFSGSIGTSQSLAAAAKTLTALISVLTEKKVVTGEQIIDGIRRIDESNTREEIAEALKAGAIRPIETVHPAALVILKQVVIPVQDPRPIVLAEYRSVELPSPFTPPQLREQLSGKKVGDTVTSSDKQKTVTTTIVEAYELVEVSKPGEQVEGEKTDGEAKEEQAPQG